MKIEQKLNLRTMLGVRVNCFVRYAIDKFDQFIDWYIYSNNPDLVVSVTVLLVSIPLGFICIFAESLGDVPPVSWLVSFTDWWTSLLAPLFWFVMYIPAIVIKGVIIAIAIFIFWFLFLTIRDEVSDWK